MRVSLNGGEVSKDKPQVVAESPLHLFDEWIGAATVNAFEITILKKSNRRAFRARPMVEFGYRILK